MSDYKTRFKERFPNLWAGATSSDILAFIDQLKREWDTEAAIECAEHERKAVAEARKEEFAREWPKRGKLVEIGRAEERAALIEKVEGMRPPKSRGAGGHEAWRGAEVIYNQALDDLLVHLRSGNGEETPNDKYMKRCECGEFASWCRGKCRGAEKVDASFEETANKIADSLGWVDEFAAKNNINLDDKAVKNGKVDASFSGRGEDTEKGKDCAGHAGCIRLLPYSVRDSIPLCRHPFCACVLLPGEVECPGCRHEETPTPSGIQEETVE